MPIDILMPALSPTMTEGTLAAWIKKEGEAVRAGDVLAEIETDKATMEVEAVDEGTLAKIVVPEGSEGVAVNAVIAVLVEEGEELPEGYAPAHPSAPLPNEASSGDLPQGQRASSEPLAGQDLKASGTSDKPAPHDAPPAVQAASGGRGSDRIKASPLARRLAQQRGLDLAQIQGSGPGGRIIKRDVDKAPAVSQPPSQPQAQPQPSTSPIAPPLAIDGPTPFEAQKPNSIRKIIARRLSESKFTSPHFYVTVDMELDALLALRKQINIDPEALKVSVNDMLIMAIGRALKAVPEANAAWVGEEIHQYARVDVSVAVALDKGLVTPVVRGADTLSLSAISAAAADLITRARNGKLKPEEMQGGSFSISNMGMLGVKQFTAIINPPQGAILAVGAGEKRPVVRRDALEIATVMTCTLSSDHRVIDGAVAAKVMAKLKSLIENPLQMLV